MEADPHELTNLAPVPAYQDVLRQMATRMWQRVYETGDSNPASSHSGMFRNAPMGTQAS